MSIYRTINQRRTVDCIIGPCGQSNADGSTDIGTPSSMYTGNQSNSNIFFQGVPGQVDRTSWQNYYFTKNNTQTSLLSFVGPDISLGKTYYDLTGRELWMIKYAWQASALVDVGALSTTGLWQWDANPLYTNSLPHYQILMNTYVIPAILQASARGIRLNIKGFHWCQGEGEALGVSNGYLTYEPVLISLIDKIVDVLTPYNALDPNFKPIISRINVPLRIRRDEVRTALVNVANHYSAPWIDTDSYPLESDSVHYTMAGQEQHGIDIATALASL